MKNKESNEIAKQAWKLRDTDGRVAQKVRQFKHTKQPSVQGWWNQQLQFGPVQFVHR